jgi:hypothetical protein
MSARASRPPNLAELDPAELEPDTLVYDEHLCSCGGIRRARGRLVDVQAIVGDFRDNHAARRPHLQHRPVSRAEWAEARRIVTAVQQRAGMRDDAGELDYFEAVTGR